MLRAAVILLALLTMCGITASPQTDSSPRKQPTSPTLQDPDDILNAPMTPPRSDTTQKKDEGDQAPGSYSSSKNRGDISPPPGDDAHPGGDVDIPPADGVMELKPWDPHQADKDVEVGMFYLKRGNYKAAEARFRDALKWQDNHAEATYRLALVLEKEGRTAEARQNYQKYLKILPSGEFAADAKKALGRLNGANEGGKKSAKKASTSPPS